LIWHYSVDALYTAFLLLRSQNLYLMVSGGSAGIMLIPFTIALLLSQARGFLARVPEDANSAVAVVESFERR
jgi:hypothetical protein